MDERGVSEVGTVFPAGQATDPTATQTGDGGAKEKVKDQAANAAGSAKEVAKETQRQVSQMAGEAGDQARQLLAQTGDQLKEHASAQTGRAAEGLRTVTSQLSALRNGRPEDAGAVGDYAQQLTDKLGELADRLDQRGFDGVVDDVQRFARRRPGLFLLAAGTAGFFAGRFLRGTQAAADDSTPSAPEHRFAGEALRTTPDPDRYVAEPSQETIDTITGSPISVDAGRGSGAF
jgi:hypothetical protein